MRLLAFFSVLLFSVQAEIGYISQSPHNNINNIVIITNAYSNDTCLGALIHPLWVVTSGTCAVKTFDYDKRVFFSNTPPMFSNGTFIENIYIHPNFNIDLLNDDVALIKLATPADKTIRTLKIAKYTFSDSLAAKKALSFGQYNTGFDNPSVLKISSVIIMNHELCARYPVSISDTRFCGFPAVGCEGDEGGPLILDNQLIGVTSISPIQAALCRYYGGCNSLFPVTTFTNLAFYRDWIVKETGLSIV